MHISDLNHIEVLSQETATLANVQGGSLLIPSPFIFPPIAVADAGADSIALGQFTATNTQTSTEAVAGVGSSSSSNSSAVAIG
ncbi:hypothetical protein [Lyngbya aestuarii]|uniref:hypothetical protein n=1 Tax=Lyngbya aestuarii TaxID=118322 RepID=UPI00403D5FAA